MKKFKLFASLSTLCLCIAVLCMGIYAAQTVTYTISGTISYTVDDALVKVNTKVYKGTNQYTTDSELDTLAKALADGTQTLDANGFTLDEAYTFTEYDSSSGQNFSKDDVNFTLSSTNKSYLVEMTIQNLSPSVNAWAKATCSIVGDNVVQGDNQCQSTISSTASKKIYFIVSIEDIKQNISSVTYSMGLNIGINDMPSTFYITGYDSVKTAYSFVLGWTWGDFLSNGDSSAFEIDNYGMVCMDWYLVTNSDGNEVSEGDLIVSDGSYDATTCRPVEPN